ncbi:MAG: Helicase associated domain protein [Bacilli bacterium]|nr:Helicase associated domain protein [Bacilli bacterium]
MNNNEYTTIGLYDHNADSYNQVKSSFESGNDVVAIVHATGTGKSYNALQLAYDNKDKKIVYVVPSHGIIEHINKIIEDNPNLDLKRDFPNLEFRTYQSFISLSEDEISDINCDLLILDEFHHIGAPIWGARINKMVETHPDMKIFGMTAYTVRDRGTSYERDMANPETDELFSGKVESRYDLCDAMIDGVLPKPVYKSAYTNLIGLESQLEEKVQKLGATTKEYQEYMAILNDVKKRIHEAPSIPNILKKSIKPDGKYIYFCPPCSEEGSNDIETIKQQAIEWFKQFVPEKDIIIYTSTSDMGEDGKKNREAFYRDVNLDGEQVDNKLRVMFAINQYNEGIHAPNIDGVIMGRGTTSDIVYFEQLGRALSVRGNTKDKFDELEQYSIEQLISMCKEKDIPIKDNISKEELIEKLIAPVVIDLTNNYDFIKDLENNLRDRIKDIQENVLGNHREMKIRDASFDIEIEDQDLFEMLRYVMDRMTMTWDDYYELAKAYYEHHGNLEISNKFKTINGYDYDENGTINLGNWIKNQRQAYMGTGSFMPLSEDKISKLLNIGMIFNVVENNWNNTYNLAKAYYEHYGNLEVPVLFRTKNGYDEDQDGIRLGKWIQYQRTAYSGKRKDANISNEQIQLLDKIGMRWNKINKMNQWMEKYNLAKAYYEHYGNLNVPTNFKTNNGYEHDENGVKLGLWIKSQRGAYKSTNHNKLTSEQIELLKAIDMIFDTYENTWKNMYNLAKAYYEHYGNLSVPNHFKTKNGYDEDQDGMSLGLWIKNNRDTYRGLRKDKKMTDERIKMLEEIGMRWDIIDKMDQWMEKYNLAKNYYEHYGNLEIPSNFTTLDGINYDEKGIRLGHWIKRQREAFSSRRQDYNLTPERIKLLEKISMRFEMLDKKLDWMEKYNLAKAYYEHYGNLSVPNHFKTKNGYEYDEDGFKLSSWIDNQRAAYKGKDNRTITSERIKLLEDIGIKWFNKNTDEKLQKEQITPENLERKKAEIQNRFYSVLNNHDSNSLTSSEELNQEILEQLNTGKKM